MKVGTRAKDAKSDNKVSRSSVRLAVSLSLSSIATPIPCPARNALSPRESTPSGPD